MAKNLRALPGILWADFKAWRRGDRRIMPRFDVNGRPIQGRVYAQRGELTEGMPVKVRAIGRMSFRVFRAGGKWEEPIDVGPIYREEK